MPGVAPNENGVLTDLWSLSPALDVFPNGKPVAEKRGLATVDVSVVSPNKGGFGGSLDGNDAGSPKVNSEEAACLCTSTSEGPPVGGACDVDPLASPYVVIISGISPKGVDGAVWGSFGNDNVVESVLNDECSATTTSRLLA